VVGGVSAFVDMSGIDVDGLLEDVVRMLKNCMVGCI
jgi:hypothetical protein